jgi:hypothetical protein
VIPPIVRGRWLALTDRGVCKDFYARGAAARCAQRLSFGGSARVLRLTAQPERKCHAWVPVLLYTDGARMTGRNTSILGDWLRSPLPDVSRSGQVRATGKDFLQVQFASDSTVCEIIA